MLKGLFNKKNRIYSVMMLIAALWLTGCASYGNVVNSSVNELKNPDEVGRILADRNNKEENIEPDIIEEEPIVYINVNVSLNGYDKDGQKYAIMVDTEHDPTQYTIVDPSSFSADGIDNINVNIKDDLYKSIAEEYIDYLTVVYDSKINQTGERPLDNEELKKAIMREADILLYLEYFGQEAQAERLKNLSKQLVYMIYESSDIADDDIVLKYNCAAILAKAIYVHDDFEYRKDAYELAQRLWDEAENSNTEDSQAEINRAWAAAELYRKTESKTFRTIVEAVCGDIDLKGVTYDNPGYYAVFAYLSSPASTNYEVSSRMMSHLFSDANTRIRQTREQFITDSIDIGNFEEEKFSDEFIGDITDGCKVVMMAQHISMSREYTRYAEDRILFLSGASPTGINYLCNDNFDRCEPVLFTLCSLN